MNVKDIKIGEIVEVRGCSYGKFRIRRLLPEKESRAKGSKARVVELEHIGDYCSFEDWSLARLATEKVSNISYPK